MKKMLFMVALLLSSIFCGVQQVNAEPITVKITTVPQELIKGDPDTTTEERSFIVKTDTTETLSELKKKILNLTFIPPDFQWLKLKTGKLARLFTSELTGKNKQLKDLGISPKKSRLELKLKAKSNRFMVNLYYLLIFRDCLANTKLLLQDPETKESTKVLFATDFLQEAQKINIPLRN